MTAEDFRKAYSANTNVKVLVKKDGDVIYDLDARIVETMDESVRVVELIAGRIPLFIRRQNYDQMAISAASQYKYCTCTASLLEVLGEDRLSVKLLEVIDIEQRRDYFRVDTTMPVHCVPQSERMVDKLKAILQEKTRGLQINPDIRHEVDEEYGLIIKKWREAEEVRSQRVNISGGGMSFYFGRDMPQGTYALLYLFAQTDTIRIVPVIARILRCKELQFDYRTRLVFEKARLAAKSETVYRVASQFVVIEPAERETLMNFISYEQIRQIQLEKKKQANILNIDNN